MSSDRSRFQRTAAAFAAILVAFTASPSAAFDRSEERGACDDATPLRQPFFGDLHIHTRLSLDASAFGTRTTPSDAYRFARGEAIDIPPYDRNERAYAQRRIDRPLDFAAVTDHAEFLGELHICETEGAKGYHSPTCAIYRRWPTLAHYIAGQRGAYLTEPKRFGFCGDDARNCIEHSKAPWQQIISAAEAAYDRSPSCRFSTFVGYEWTGAPDGDNLHRNVIFRNASVPEVALSYTDTPRVEMLWQRLIDDCQRGTPGCDVLAIPHNSNLSGGRMFQLADVEHPPYSKAVAMRWQQMEPLIELIQHKGSSECRPGVGTNDELCGFEQLPFANFLGFSLGQPQQHPPLNYVRNALKVGLAHEASTGANPFRFGFIGSTDTHYAIPGDVAEANFAGHMHPGYTDEDLPERIPFNPGGLAVLWAEENSRDSLFEAMRRRETYATSGPRLRARFFGGFDLADDLCGDANFAARGYADGVPMGGVIEGTPATSDRAEAPSLRFAAWTLADPGTASAPGTPLQRIQIVKGWLEDGEVKERIWDVAGDPNNGARVDLDTCAPQGDGFAELCRVWRDPSFDPDQPAFYYARTIENPTCRWSTHICTARGVDCGDPSSVPAGLRDCCNEDYPRFIQERAWTSPIWYVPASH